VVKFSCCFRNAHTASDLCVMTNHASDQSGPSADSRDGVTVGVRVEGYRSVTLWLGLGLRLFMLMGNKNIE